MIFDSKLTTYANLSKINGMGINFITLRRRSKKLMEEMRDEPVSAWRRIGLNSISRLYRNPKILDREIVLGWYEGSIWHLTITDLGREEPTLLITNQLAASAVKFIDRYAHRMVIENGIQDNVDFFHMDALSSAVAMKVNCDVILTLIGIALRHMLVVKVGEGHQTYNSKHIFRDMINATGEVTIEKNETTVRLQKRAHNPYLIAAGFTNTDIQIPGLRIQNYISSGANINLCGVKSKN